MLTTSSFRILFFLSIASIFACSANLEADLRKASSDPNAVMIVKDRDGNHVAFSAGRIVKIEGNKVTLKAGTLITKGSGTASSDAIARELRTMRSKANPGGFGATESTITGTSGSITIKNEVLEKETTIDVAEIVSLTGATSERTESGEETATSETATPAGKTIAEAPIGDVRPGGGIQGGVVSGVPGGVVDGAPTPVDPKSKNAIKTISGGVLNGKATSLPQPAYPPAARAVKASGVVSVQVTVNTDGNVISAVAVSGHPLLRAAAVQAARSARFAPTMLSGQPVKVTGVVTYNFVLQ
jgi:TonB family protein